HIPNPTPNPHPPHRHHHPANADRRKGEAASTRLSITRHTDSVGSDAYNQKLTERRGNAVAIFVIPPGVPTTIKVGVPGVG
ncbi:hypothetical protein ACPTGO_31440, partial [Pseudomonas aeruginosa]